MAGIYEGGIRTMWRGMMRVAEARVDRVATLGAEAAGAGAHANPVLLVHGFGNDASAMGAIGRSLTRDGFNVHAISLPEHGMGDAYRDAEMVGAKIRQILDATGAKQVDLVGHSRGGIVSRTWAQLLDTEHTTGRVVTLTSANQGIHLGVVDGVGGLLLPDGMKQIRRGQQLVRELAQSAPTSPADLVAVGTRGFDGLVLPRVASQIPGREFIAIDGGRTVGPFSRVGHYGMLRDDATYEALRGALLARRG